MITQWRLENFKPVATPLSLELGMVTVLAGLNSSGKSSLIQSMLLMSQTMANPNPERPLILNGHVVQLGTFDSVCNERAQRGPIRVGFTFDAGSERGPRMSRFRSARFAGTEDFGVMISLDSAFSSGASGAADVSRIEGVQVRLAETRMSLELTQHFTPRPGSSTPSRGPTVRVALSVSPVDGEALAKATAGIGSEYSRLLPHSLGDLYVGTIEGDSRTYFVRMNHLLPDRFVAKFNVLERTRSQVRDAVEGLFSSMVFYSDPRIGKLARTDRVLSDTLIAELGKIADDKKVPRMTGNSVGDAIAWAQACPLKTRAKSWFTNAVKSLLTSDILKELNKSRDHEQVPWGLETVSDGIQIFTVDAAVQRTIAHFATRVRYIGPLRADPQAAQRFAPSSEPDDVGTKGEYAAAVYEANRGQVVRWLNPNDDSIRDSSLGEAVDTWAAYLGVAHHVSIREAGVSGVSWFVQPRPGSVERPLQSVGVGVSQVLPILVAGLLAPTGALILIEQPELHLHARAQARLGEFFAGLARCGKQCVLETHSDCLVNQLRLHIVAGGDSARALTKIYFVTQDEAGSAQFEQVRISPRGNIVNWPDGFFDTSLHQEDAITRAALASITGGS